MSRSERDRLGDIEAAIAKVNEFRPSLQGEYAEMAVSAILREIGVIGEAVNYLPAELLAQRPEVQWRNIANMRNFLVHEYFRIDRSVVEDVIANDLESLSLAVQVLLADLD